MTGCREWALWFIIHHMSTPSQPVKRRTSLFLLTVIALIILVVLRYPPSEWVPAHRLGMYLEAAGLPGISLFLCLAILATSAGFPRQLVAFIAGLAYGVWPGLLLSLVAALSGCYLTVRLARRFLSQRLRQRYPDFIAKLDSLLQDDVFVKVLILRLQPLGTNLLTNVCVGFTHVSLGEFLLASAVGYVPQMLIFSLLGHGIRVGSQTQLIISLVLLAISIMLGLLLYRRHRLRRVSTG